MTNPADRPEDPPYDKAEIAARTRVRLPARLLLFVSLLNLVTGIIFMVHAITLKKQGVDADLRELWDEFEKTPEAMWLFQGWTPETFLSVFANTLLGYGGISGLASVLTLAGARQMVELRSYGLAVTAAVLTAIPCITPCCLLGQVVGVWAFVMLMQPDVRRAFQ